jgi:hypothetical protein
MELSPSDDLHELKRDLIAAHSLEGSAPALPLPTLLSRARILVLRKVGTGGRRRRRRRGGVRSPTNAACHAPARMSCTHWRSGQALCMRPSIPETRPLHCHCS